eukprot:6959322-Pyramimonas_sp.AAC.1
MANKLARGGRGNTQVHTLAPNNKAAMPLRDRYTRIAVRCTILNVRLLCIKILPGWAVNLHKAEDTFRGYVCSWRLECTLSGS